MHTDELLSAFAPSNEFPAKTTKLNEKINKMSAALTIGGSGSRAQSAVVCDTVNVIGWGDQGHHHPSSCCKTTTKKTHTDTRSPRVSFKRESKSAQTRNARQALRSWRSPPMQGIIVRCLTDTYSATRLDPTRSDPTRRYAAFSPWLFRP